MPQLWVVAGPNGTGKSTLANKYLAGRLLIVNPDVIAQALATTDPHGTQVRLQAGRGAIRRQEELLAQGVDFAIETTLSGNRELAFMRRAQNAGYKVNLVYVGVDTPTTTLGRIAQRHRGLLVGAYHTPLVFRIKLLRESCRVDQIAEHHRELATFGFRGGRGGCKGDAVDQVVWLGVRLRSDWRRAHGWRLGRRGLTNPHQHSPPLIHSQPFGLDEFVLEGFKLIVVQAELHFEGPIRHAPLALEQLRHLGKDGIKVHHRPFSMARAWGTIYGRALIHRYHGTQQWGSQVYLRVCARD